MKSTIEKKSIRVLALVSLLAMLATSGVLAISTAVGGATTRVSVSSAGEEGNNNSYSGSISGDGRYVVFNSTASNLVSNDGNDSMDVFVHDWQSGETRIVSIASNGTQQGWESRDGTISSDGRYIAYMSEKTNLVTDDTNGCADVFVFDMQTGQISRVSVASDGTEGNGSSSNPSISSDGRYVAFHSWATNLVSGDSNDESDVFVHDRQSGQTTLVSVGSDGTHGNSHSMNPSISGDGRYVAFESRANNFVSYDDNGYVDDVYIHDSQTGQTILASIALDGTAGNAFSINPSISSDGHYAAFESAANDLVDEEYYDIESDIFVYYMVTGDTTRVSARPDGSRPIGSSWTPSLSADGRFVVFGSNAIDLSADCMDAVSRTDVFLYDRSSGQTECVSKSTDGLHGNNFSSAPIISANGFYVTFQSAADNLVPDDTNDFCDTDFDGEYDDNCRDVFVRHWFAGDYWIYVPTIMR